MGQGSYVSRAGQPLRRSFLAVARASFLNFTEHLVRRTMKRMRILSLRSLLCVIIGGALTLASESVADTLDNFLVSQAVTATAKAPEATVTTTDPRSAFWSARTLGGMLQSSCQAGAPPSISVKSGGAEGLVASFNQATGLAVASYQVKGTALQPFIDGKLSLRVRSSKIEPLHLVVDLSSSQSRFSASTTFTPKKGLNTVSFSIRSGFPGLTSNELAQIEQLSISVRPKSCLTTITVRDIALTTSTNGLARLFSKFVRPSRAKRKASSSNALVAATPTPSSVEYCDGPETAGRSCTPDPEIWEALSEEESVHCASIPFVCNPDGGECLPQLLSGLSDYDLADDPSEAFVRQLGFDESSNMECFRPDAKKHLEGLDPCIMLGLTPGAVRAEIDRVALLVGSKCVRRDPAGNALGNGICDDSAHCVEPPPRVERCGTGVPECTPCSWDGVERRFCFRGECRTAQQAARIYCPEQLRRFSPDAQCQRCSAFFHEYPSPSGSCVSGYMTGSRRRLLYGMDGAMCIAQDGSRGTCSNERCIFPSPGPTPAYSPSPTAASTMRLN